MQVTGGAPQFMAEALRLARRGLGRTNPNPPVGAVVVRGTRIVGRGHHCRCGELHAEVVALREAGKAARGADLYVTLEPCGHTGRTPPCAEVIIQKGIRRVFFGCPDPNPLTAGKGPALLREAGVEVTEGPLSSEARYFHAPYLKWVATGTPLVTAKWAMTLDGKIGTRTQHARWITEQKARRAVHALRGEIDAVVVGTNTVLVDDPLLTCRIRSGRTPLRVLLDRRQRLPAQTRIFQTADQGPIVLYTSRIRTPYVRRLRALGIDVVKIPCRRGRLSLREILRDLGTRAVHHLLVEGGAKLLGSFFDEKLVDRVVVFVAPKIVGGKEAVNAVAGQGVLTMNEALVARVRKVRRYGPDLALWADVCSEPSPSRGKDPTPGAPRAEAPGAGPGKAGRATKKP